MSAAELEANFRLTELCFMKMVKYGKSVSGVHSGKALPRLEYLSLDMTIFELKQMIYSRVKHIYKEALPDDKEINRCIMIHVVDNLPYMMASKYSRKKAPCEYCLDTHGSSDTCDAKIHKMSPNSEEGAKQIKIRDFYEKMEHKRDLILGIVFREGSGAILKHLDPNFDQSHIEDQKKQSKDMITLDSCFKAYSREELLTGQD